MTLQEQITETTNELSAYKKASFADPKIIQWLESVLESLFRLQNLEK